MKALIITLTQVSSDTNVALIGARIGLVVGISIGIISGIGILINKIRNKKSKGLVWSMVFGACATVTGIMNILTLTK